MRDLRPASIEIPVRCFRPLVLNAPLRGARSYFCRVRTIVIAKLNAKSRFLTLCYIMSNMRSAA